MLNRDTLGALTGLAFVALGRLVWALIPPHVPAVSLTDYGATPGLSPRLFPRLAVGAFSLTGGLLLAVSLWRRLRRPAEGEPVGLDVQAAARAALFVGLTAAYLWLLPRLGYLLASPMVIAAAMLLFGERRWGWILAVSLGATGAIFLFFRYGMVILPPEGALLR